MKTIADAAVARIYEWEIVKLLAQKRITSGLISAAILVPIVSRVGARPPDRRARTTCRSAATSATRGLAVPFVVLFFMSIWGLPLITALVAGDIVAAETTTRR